MRETLSGPYFTEEPDIKRAAFERLYHEYVLDGASRVIVYDSAYPKHEFLEFLIKEKGLLLHGSNHPDIHELEPRQANDRAKVTGNQLGVYAVDNHILPLFFAIKDRERFFGRSESGYVRDEKGDIAKYLFRVEKEVLAQQPWSSGVVYILSKESFEQQHENGRSTGEWVSPRAVKPCAVLSVSPDDFPYLSEIEGL